MIMIVRLFSLLFLVCFFSPLHGQDDQSSTEALVQVPEVGKPNPVDLEAEWLSYFEVDQEILKERVAEVRALLDSLQTQLESEEEKQEAETRIKEFQSYFDALLLLKKEEIRQPPVGWLHKATYTLDDFLEISDQIRNLKLDIYYRNTDLQRYNYIVDDLRQELNNAYAEYLSLSDHTKEKFKQGLKGMSLGARLLYLEAELEAASKQIKIDEKLLKRYQEEQDFINEESQFLIDPQKVEVEKEKLKKKLSVVHSELLGLESQSIKIIAEKNGQAASRQINLKLTNLLIQEALIRSKLVLLDAVLTFYEALQTSQVVDYAQDVEPIKTFRNKTRKQLDSWRKIVGVEIDQLSQILVKGDDMSVEGERAYEDSLKLSLSSRAYFEDLSRELYHIGVFLGLIDQHVIKRQTVLDQISYFFQSFWQWFTDSFGVWLYYSLFEIGGVPITLIGLFKAFLIVIVAIWFSNFLGRALKQFAKGKGRAIEPTFYTFRRIIHYLILVVGVLFALASLGLTMRNMAIVLGALGIGIGFGLQNIVNNFLCGLAILFERNVKIGDYVELESGYLGRITEVSVQNTTLHTFDGLDVLVPNSSLIANNVVNWTKKDPYQRLHIPFGVAYGTDQAKVSKVVIEAALKIRYTMKSSEGLSDPEVWLVEFGDSSLNFELVVWVNIFKSRGRRAMKAEYLAEIEKGLNEHGIHIPFPQRDLHLKSLPAEGIQKVKL